MRYGLKVISPFTDKYTGVELDIGDTLETKDPERFENLLNRALGKAAYIRTDKKKTGKRVLVCLSVLYKVGGIETAMQHIARAFDKHNITFLTPRADIEQMRQLGKTHDVIIDDGISEYTADVVLLMNYDSAEQILDRIKAKRIYQFVHADWQGLKSMGAFDGFSVKIDPRVDKILAVSDTAQKGLKSAYGYESTVVPNIFFPEKRKRVVFLFLSRATNEKGVDKLIDLSDRFEAAGKDFVIFLCSPLEQSTKEIRNQIEARSKIVPIPPSIYAKELLRGADYLIQLSNNESYCYSVREALSCGVPVICSDIPEFRKIIKPGENGYIIHGEPSSAEVEKIFNLIPKPKPYTEKISPLWHKVLEGEL